MWCPLPAAIHPQFIAARNRAFIELYGIFWPLVLLVVVLVATLLWGCFGDLMTGRDGQVAIWMQGLVAAQVILAIFALRPEARRAHFVPILCSVTPLTLATLVAASSLYHSPVLQQLTNEITIVALLIIILPLKLPLRAGVSSALAGLVMGAMAANWLGGQIIWRLMLSFYLGSLAVIYLIGLLMVRQERVNFLQSLLLEHESGERMRLNAMLERLALEDQLTGLANRRQFNESLYNEWNRCLRNEQSIALLFMDIDYFKRYNDTYGHSAGDLCLASVAGAIKASLLRPADLAARFGGEEFVVLLPETDECGAMEVAQRILSHIDALAIPHAQSDAAGHVTTSIGISVRTPQENQSSHLLLETADRALYQAKAGGRHQVAVFRELIAPANLSTLG